MKWYDNMTYDLHVEQFREQLFPTEREGNVYAKFVLGMLVVQGVYPIEEGTILDAVEDLIKSDDNPDMRVLASLVFPKAADYVVGWDRVSNSIMERFLGVDRSDMLGRHKYLVGHLAKLISTRDDITALKSIQEMLLTRKPETVQEELIYAMLAGTDYLRKLDVSGLPVNVSLENFDELKFKAEFNAPSSFRFGEDKCSYDEVKGKISCEMYAFCHKIPVAYQGLLSYEQLLTCYIHSTMTGQMDIQPKAVDLDNYFSFDD